MTFSYLATFLAGLWIGGALGALTAVLGQVAER
ncbi:gas vesicle protein [Acetobacter oeni]|nr:gas vesicle protein [Acetobacter oeni]